MSARASRRQVLAAIALQTDLPAPNEVTFVEGAHSSNGYRLDIYLDSVAELHVWLPYFGMTEGTVHAQPYTHTVDPYKGQTTTLASAFSRDEWRGWRVHLTALDPVTEPEPELELDEQTREQLAAVADDTRTATA